MVIYKTYGLALDVLMETGFEYDKCLYQHDLQHFIIKCIYVYGVKVSESYITHFLSYIKAKSVMVGPSRVGSAVSLQK